MWKGNFYATVFLYVFSHIATKFSTFKQPIDNVSVWMSWMTHSPHLCADGLTWQLQNLELVPHPTSQLPIPRPWGTAMSTLPACPLNFNQGINSPAHTATPLPKRAL